MLERESEGFDNKSYLFNARKYFTGSGVRRVESDFLSLGEDDK